MADRTPAETALLDQTYARMVDGLDGLVRDSRAVLDELSPEDAAQLLTKSIVGKGIAPCVVASYLAVAVVRLQRGAADG